MTREEAIKRIKDHMEVHKLNEPRAIKITEALDMAIKALEQEPCEDAISRQAVFNIIEKEQFKGDAIAEIEKLPSVTPKQRTGHWIKTISENGITSAARCSECGFEDNRYMLFRYCPTCGIKMVELQESEGEDGTV